MTIEMKHKVPVELKSKSKSAGSIAVSINGMAGSGISSEIKSLSDVSDVIELASSDSSFKGQIIPSKKNNSLSESVFNMCKEKGLLLQELKVEEGRLDDVFRELTVADTVIEEKSNPSQS